MLPIYSRRTHRPKYTDPKRYNYCPVITVMSPILRQIYWTPGIRKDLLTIDGNLPSDIDPGIFLLRKGLLKELLNKGMLTGQAKVDACG